MALYDDIGGAPAVRAALDAFYPRVLADTKLSPFFQGVDIDRVKRTQEGFFAMALGGPNNYTGRSLPDAHARARQRGMNDEVFDHFLTVFKGVLSIWESLLERSANSSQCSREHAVRFSTAEPLGCGSAVARADDDAGPDRLLRR